MKVIPDRWWVDEKGNRYPSVELTEEEKLRTIPWLKFQEYLEKVRGQSENIDGQTDKLDKPVPSA